jgi:hypothetical protein
MQDVLDKVQTVEDYYHSRLFLCVVELTNLVTSYDDAEIGEVLNQVSLSEDTNSGPVTWDRIDSFRSRLVETASPILNGIGADGSYKAHTMVMLTARRSAELEAVSVTAKCRTAAMFICGKDVDSLEALFALADVYSQAREWDTFPDGDHPVDVNEQLAAFAESGEIRC